MSEYRMQLIDESYSLPLIEAQVVENSSNTCMICMHSESLFVLDACGHKFCNGCLKSYMELKISEAQVNEIICPTCSASISDDTIESLISPKNFKKYKNFLKIKQLELDIYVKWCPVADCKGYDIASEDNIKLTCNECGHKYCYLCSGEWHKGKCKDNTELSFKLWAMGNNLKICPRCKNHVQKNGGCPHMTCPRCQFQWCWRCGKSRLSGAHNDFNCVIGKNKLDLYWSIILIMLLLPVLFPFIFFLAFAFLYEPIDHPNAFFKFLNNFWGRLVLYCLLFCLSPALEVLCFVVGTVCFIFIMPMVFSRRKWDLYFVYFGMCIVIYCLVLAAAAIIFVLCPVVGLFFLVMKFFYACKRCKGRNTISFEYRRTFA